MKPARTELRVRYPISHQVWDQLSYNDRDMAHNSFYSNRPLRILDEVEVRISKRLRDMYWEGAFE